MRAKETLAMTARWKDCDRDVMVVFYGSTGCTADLPDVAMNLGEFFRARRAMKAVDILRNQPKFLAAPLKFRNGDMEIGRASRRDSGWHSGRAGPRETAGRDRHW